MNTKQTLTAFLYLVGAILLFIVASYFFALLAQGVGSYYKSVNYPSGTFWGGFVELDNSTLENMSECELDGRVYIDDPKSGDLYRTTVSGMILSWTDDKISLVVSDSGKRPFVWKFRSITPTKYILGEESTLGTGSCATLSLVNWNGKRPDYIFPETYKPTRSDKYFLKTVIPQNVMVDLLDRVGDKSGDDGLSAAEQHLAADDAIDMAIFEGNKEAEKEILFTDLDIQL